MFPTLNVLPQSGQGSAVDNGSELAATRQGRVL